MNEISASVVDAFESVTLANERQFTIFKVHSAAISGGYIATPNSQLGNLLTLTNHALGQLGSQPVLGEVADFTVIDHPSNANARVISFKLASGAIMSFEIPRITCMLLSDNLMTRL